MVWYDNWTILGDLYMYNEDNTSFEDQTTVRKLVEGGEWNVQLLNEMFQQDIVQHIINNIKPPKEERGKDKPYWMLEVNGCFTVKSFWHYIRHKEDKNKIFKGIWTKGVPFKIAFLIWRLWKQKVPVDDTL